MSKGNKAFYRASSIEELSAVKARIEQKLVKNKKKLDAREIGRQRSEISATFSTRAQEIIAHRA